MSERSSVIVDCFTHVWESSDDWGPVVGAPDSRNGMIVPDRGPVIGTLSRHQTASRPVDVTLVMGFQSRFLGVELSNERVATYVRGNPDRLIGIAGIDPSHPRQAMQNLRTARGELGLRGVSVAPAAQNFHPADSGAMSVYAEAVRLGMPVFFHNGLHSSPSVRMAFAQPILLDDVAREFPKLKIVVAHLGYPWVAETIQLLEHHPQVFTEISGLIEHPWRAYQALLQAYQHGVMHKLLFGSGFPFGSAAHCIEELYSLHQLGHGTNLPIIPRDQIRGIVERDSLALLGLAFERSGAGIDRSAATESESDEDADVLTWNDRQPIKD